MSKFVSTKGNYTLYPYVWNLGGLSVVAARPNQASSISSLVGTFLMGVVAVSGLALSG